jgi:hypothetical protein
MLEILRLATLSEVTGPVYLHFSDSRVLQIDFDTHRKTKAFEKTRRVSLRESNRGLISSFFRNKLHIKNEYPITPREVLNYFEAAERYSRGIYSDSLPPRDKSKDPQDNDANYWRSFFELWGINGRIRKQFEIPRST